MSLVDDGQRNPEPEVLEVSDLLRELDDLGQEVDPELEGAAAASPGSDVVDREDSALTKINSTLNYNDQRNVGRRLACSKLLASNKFSLWSLC